MADEDEDELNRFNDPPAGPIVSIFGGVKWPKEWGIAEKRKWIEIERGLDDDLFAPGQPQDPNGIVAVLEYDLNPVGLKPNYLKYLRDLNPDHDWPDNPETLTA